MNIQEQAILLQLGQYRSAIKCLIPSVDIASCDVFLDASAKICDCPFRTVLEDCNDNVSRVARLAIKDIRDGKDISKEKRSMIVKQYRNLVYSCRDWLIRNKSEVPVYVLTDKCINDFINGGTDG